MPYLERGSRSTAIRRNKRRTTARAAVVRVASGVRTGLSSGAGEVGGDDVEVAREVLYRRQLHTLRPIGDEFPGRPARRIDAAAQLVDLALRYFDSERPDRALRARSRGVANYRVLPVCVRWASCRSSSVAASKRTSLDDHKAEVQVAVEDEYRLPACA